MNTPAELSTTTEDVFTREERLWKEQAPRPSWARRPLCSELHVSGIRCVRTADHDKEDPTHRSTIPNTTPPENVQWVAENDDLTREDGSVFARLISMVPVSERETYPHRIFKAWEWARAFGEELLTRRRSSVA